MARETKKAQQYPCQLMYVLGRACKLGYKLTVRFDEFCIEDHNGEFWYFEYVYSTKSSDALYTLNLQVDSSFVKKKNKAERLLLKLLH